MFRGVWSRLPRASQHWPPCYLMTEAAGRSQATLDAKRRDLQRFLVFYQDLYKAQT